MSSKKKPNKRPSERRCAGPSCKAIIIPSKPWHKYCGSKCRMAAFFLRRGKELGA